MIYIIAVIVITMLLTTGAARLSLSRWPAMSDGGHIGIAAMSVPTLATLIMILLTFYTILQRTGPADEGPLGMIIFAFLMFWIIAVGVGLLVGVPTAIVAVKAFRG